MTASRPLSVAFRVDASLDIGTGHVMRCLTLADALAARGAVCRFICREHPGHLIEHIRSKGYPVQVIPAGPRTQTEEQQPGSNNPLSPASGGEGWGEGASRSTSYDPHSSPSPRGRGVFRDSQPTPNLLHAHWLGCDWETDAEQTEAILNAWPPDWLVLDHYALDERWEKALQGCYKKLMVIDDLADRPHACDVLLDQNLGRKPGDYEALVPVYCQRLIGPHYALLRPEFAALCEYSLRRRQTPMLKRLLITMGGVDQPNATGKVLEALKACPLPSDCRITVVMGGWSPWLEQVRTLAATLPWATEVRVNITDMAKVMADSDLAIGAAGSTSWERCCLGLPSLLVVLAENQLAGALALHDMGAALSLGEPAVLSQQLASSLRPLLTGRLLAEMSLAARTITDGQGAARVLQHMELQA